MSSNCNGWEYFRCVVPFNKTIKQYLLFIISKTTSDTKPNKYALQLQHKNQTIMMH